MVRPGKILSRKVAKFEKKQEARTAVEDNTATNATDKARKATNKKAAKLKSKGNKKATIAKVHVSAGEGEEDDVTGLTPEERKELRIAKLKANLHAKKTGVRSALSLETAVAHAQATVNKKGGNSLNLKSAQRHDVFVSELNHFNRAMTIPEFKADPFGTIEAHIMQTSTMLRKQTPDIGRKVDQKGPVMRHAGYGPGTAR